MGDDGLGGGEVVGHEGGYRRSGARGAPQLFAHKLYKLVDEEDSEIVDWMPDGQGFQVKDMVRFCSEVIVKYFNHCKFTSFQRQLNLYGFKKRRGDRAGAFYHPHFQKGQQQLLSRVRRQRVNRDLVAAAQRQAAAQRNAAGAGPGHPPPPGRGYHGAGGLQPGGIRRSMGPGGMGSYANKPRRDSYAPLGGGLDGRWVETDPSTLRAGMDRRDESLGGWDWQGGGGHPGVRAGPPRASHPPPLPQRNFAQDPMPHLPGRQSPHSHVEQGNPFRLPVSFMHRGTPALHMPPIQPPPGSRQPGPPQMLPPPRAGVSRDVPAHLQLPQHPGQPSGGPGPGSGPQGVNGSVAAAVAAVKAAAMNDSPAVGEGGGSYVSGAPWQHVLRSTHPLPYPTVPHFYDSTVAGMGGSGGGSGSG
ncbi:unnamed protein product, partial [Discosporangium mesarthrocarpum]